MHIMTLVSVALENGCKASDNDNCALCEGPAEFIMLVWAYSMSLIWLLLK